MMEFSFNTFTVNCNVCDMDSFMEGANKNLKNVLSYQLYKMFSSKLCNFFVLYTIQVNRRSWAGNAKAEETICRTMDENPGLKVTVPYHVQDKDLLKRVLKD